MTQTWQDPDVRVVPPSSAALVAYRAAVARVTGCADAVGAIRRAAEDPDVRPVLDALPADADRTLARIEAEVAAFRPSPRSNVATPTEHGRLLLLQQIDVLWWSSPHAPAPFADDDVVGASPELVRLDRAGADFRWRVSTKSWPPGPATARSVAGRPDTSRTRRV